MVRPMYGKPERSGALPQSAMPLFYFKSAQAIERPHHERQGGLLPSATLLVLTRVKLDRSSGRAKGGNVLCPATSTPGKQIRIRP